MGPGFPWAQGTKGQGQPAVWPSPPLQKELSDPEMGWAGARSRPVHFYSREKESEEGEWAWQG